METAGGKRIDRDWSATGTTPSPARWLLLLACAALIWASVPGQARALYSNLETNAEDVSEDQGASKDPIILEDGAVTESATDIALPAVVGVWTHSRQYSSKLSGGVHIQGCGWMSSPLTTFLKQKNVGDDLYIYVYLNHLCKRGFKYNTQTEEYEPPDDFNATLTTYEQEEEGKTYDYAKLQYAHTGETFHFRGFNGNWNKGAKGLLVKRTDRYGTEEVTYEYDNNEPGGRIKTVTSTQGWAIVYTYIQQGQANAGNISQIDVYDGGDPETDNVIWQVKYTYYKTGQGYSENLGSQGDLVMVKVLKRATGDPLENDPDESDFSIKHVTMYRYGSGHKLKMVLSPASVAKAMEEGNKTESDLLGLADSGIVTGSKQLQDYANVTYTYYTSDYNTDTALPSDGSVGPLDPEEQHEDLEAKYGGTNINETGFVASQTVHKDYRGFLGTRTYFYMGNHNEGTNVNAVTRIVLEDTTLTWNGSARTGTRKTYGLNKDRQILREVFIDDPKAETPKYWCTSYVVGSTSGQDHNKVVEKRMPSAHSCVNTPSEVRTFLDVDETSEWDNSNIMHSSSGVVYVYDYNSDGFLAKEKVKKGRTGDPRFLRVVEYGDGEGNRVTYLPWKTHVYHTATTNENTDSARFTTTTTYDFHDDNKQQMETKTISHESVPTSHNGSDTAIEKQEYYDDRGRLRWTKDGEGRVNYYSYHPDTGGLAYTVVDVETDNMPGGVTSDGGGKRVAWSGDVPFDQEATALGLVTEWEYDEVGRQIKVTDPEGTLTCTVHLDNETRVYPGWDDTTHTTALPIRVEKTNDDDLTLEMYAVDPAEVTEGFNQSTDLPTGSDNEGQDDYVSWARYTYYDVTALPRFADRYHDIPNSGTGTLSTNFYRTVYRYSEASAGYNGALGRRTHVIQVVSGTGTGSSAEQVTKTNYDALGRVTSVERGVSATGHDMTSNYTTDPTLKKVAATFYDESTLGSGTSGVGDGLITSTLAYYDADNIDESHAVETIYRHNWRGQLRGIQPEAAPFTVQDVDNPGRVVAVAQFTTAPTWSTVLGDDHYAENAIDSNRRSLSKTLRDEMGRIYATEVYAVSSSGVKGDKVRTDNYYDRNSRLVATASPGQGGVEYAYDGAGRRTGVRATKALRGTCGEEDYYVSGAFHYCDPAPGASSGGNEGIYEMTRTTYDKVGNVTKTITMEMNHGDTTSLGISLTDNDFVRTFTYHWYEPKTYHLKTTAYYGSGREAWSYQGTAPTYTSYANRPTSSGSSCLVTAYAYDDAGRLQTVTDPKGYDTKTTCDDLGRRIKVEEADGETEERWTLTEYDGLSNVTKAIADIGKDDTHIGGVWTTDADSQVTTYTYYNSTRSPYRAGLVTQIKYPDGDDTDDNVQMTYALNGQVTKRARQKLSGEGNRTDITFEYDATFRRFEKQRVTQAGGADTAVQSIKTTYDSLSRIEKVTSYSDNNCSTVVNEVQRTYNDLGALEKDYQAHAGAVNTGSSPYVEYGYDDTADEGIFDKDMRLKSVRYPDARTVYYLYADAGDSSGLGDSISRLTAIASATTRGGSDANVYAAYAYNGAARVVEVTHPKVTNGLKLTCSASGKYTGFDRFGRVRWQRWTNASGTWKDVIFYGYDYAGNPSYRCARKNRFGVGDFSEAYAYDKLHRLTGALRGCLFGIAPIGGDINNDGVIDSNDYDIIDLHYALGDGDVWEEGDLDGDGDIDANDYDIINTNYASPPSWNVTRTWEWTLDAPGNWNEYKYDVGNGSSWDLDQDRANNLANEIDGNGGNPLYGTPNWVDPAYDAAGNVTFGPCPGSETTAADAHHLIYDAWNRLVQVWEDDGDGTLENTGQNPDDTRLAVYHYDGLGRRIHKTLGEQTSTDEYFTTYDETDPNSRIAVTASKLDVDGLQRNEDARVYLDVGYDLTDKCEEATAHTEYSATYAPSKAIDGSTSTYWCSQNGDISDTWIKYDFGADNAKTLTEYRIYPVGTYYRPKDWQLQGSNNDSDWTNIGDAIDDYDTEWESGWNTFEVTNSTAYRYYRLHITDSNDGSYVGMAELDMGQARASASTEYYAASKATDDSTSTYWLSQSGDTSDAWLKYDFGLGNAEVLTEYRIYPSGTYYRPKDWQLQGSNNDSDWTNIGDAIDDYDTEWESGWNTFEVTNSTAYRYYRLHITDSNDGSYVGVAELDMGQARASASTEYYAASKAVDNSTTTYWLCANGDLTDGADLVYDFGVGNTATLTQYAITCPSYVNYATKDWKLQGSNNGSSWTDLHTVTDEDSWTASETKAYDEGDFTNTTAYRYYRLHITEAKSGTYAGVAELHLPAPPVGPDFRHDFEVTHQSGTTGRAAVWALSNDLDDVKNWDDDDDEAVSVTLVGAASPTLVLTDHESGTSDTSTSLTTQTTYYCTVERTADTTVECRIYSNSARTTLVDTLSASVTSGRTWRYLLACNSYNDSSADAISFDVENLYACSDDGDRADYFHNNVWQVVEERKNGSDDPSIQYVWDARYIDAPICRDKDTSNGSGGDPDGDCIDSDDEHLYYCTDANFNVTSLVEGDGDVVERYVYDPYGKVTVLHGADDADGAVTEWDEDTGGSDWDNEILYCGYRYDPETALYHVRHRMYHPTLGRWLQRDPLGYIDGLSLYEYVRSRPPNMCDPLGLKSSKEPPLPGLPKDHDYEGPGRYDGLFGKVLWVLDTVWEIAKVVTKVFPADSIGDAAARSGDVLAEKELQERREELEAQDKDPSKDPDFVSFKAQVRGMGALTQYEILLLKDNDFDPRTGKKLPEATIQENKRKRREAKEKARREAAERAEQKARNRKNRKQSKEAKRASDKSRRQWESERRKQREQWREYDDAERERTPKSKSPWDPDGWGVE